MVENIKDRQGSGAESFFEGSKAFWRWWSAEEEKPNPFTGIPRPKCKARTVPVLQPEQIEAIFDACKGKSKLETLRNTAIAWLLLESGLRRADLCALNVEDVDIKGHTVNVINGKGGKSRISVFGDDSAAAVWRWLKVRNTMPSASHSSALFLSKFGRLSSAGLSYVVTQIGRKAGVPLHPHQFRHAAAHYQLASGQSEGNLMAVFGWATRSMVDRYGAQLREERAIAACTALPVGKILKGGTR